MGEFMVVLNPRPGSRVFICFVRVWESPHLWVHPSPSVTTNERPLAGLEPKLDKQGREILTNSANPPLAYMSCFVLEIGPWATIIIIIIFNHFDEKKLLELGLTMNSFYHVPRY